MSDSTADATRCNPLYNEDTPRGRSDNNAEWEPEWHRCPDCPSIDCADF